MLATRRQSSVAQDGDPPGRIAFGRMGNIWVWSGGETKQLFEDGNASDPRWSPNGQELLFVRQGDSYSDLFVRYLSAGTEAQLTYNQPDAPIGSVEYVTSCVWAVDPAWSPSGVIAFASDYFTPGGIMTLWLMNDLTSGQFDAAAAQDEGSIDGVTLSADGGVAGYTVRAIDDDGANYTYVALRDLSDGIAYTLVDDLTGSYDAAISPNDRDVAVVIRDESGRPDIWIVDRQTSDRARVTEGEEAAAPCWSPDGRWIAYLRLVDFDFELVAAPLNGGIVGARKVLARFRDIDAPGGLAWTYEPE
jgi:TolB protein